MATITNRSEIVFLYDTTYCNPNGDPMDANRPRINEETGKCLVTDVRLKRTIRVSIDEETEGAEEQLDTQKTFHFTGAVQFGMGKSFNKVKENFIKGTGAFATKETSIQRTFREEYNITYGLIGFHGVINENAAKTTNLSESDVNELIEGMWNGTKNLLTRSKKGHMPRLLIKIDYSQKGFFIGDLLERLTLVYNETVKEDDLESIEQFKIDTSKLIETLTKYDSKISNITVIKDDRISFTEPIPTKAPLTYESISI